MCQTASIPLHDERILSGAGNPQRGIDLRAPRQNRGFQHDQTQTQTQRREEYRVLRIMAARTRKIRHDDETRAKIQAAQIINRFHACLMGEITLDAQQVSCGKALLAKILPDLSAVDHSGEVETSYVVRAPQPIAGAEEWELKYSSPPTVQ